MRKMATIPEIRNEIMDNSKLVYFAAGEQTTISWKEVPCDIVDVASKPYFKVIKSQEIVTLPSICKTSNNNNPNFSINFIVL